MIISKNCSAGISTRVARLCHNFGISPDIRGMPPDTKLFQWSMDLPSFTSRWRQISDLHRLETPESPVPFTLHWPPSQRLTQPSHPAFADIATGIELRTQCARPE